MGWEGSFGGRFYTNKNIHTTVLPESGRATFMCQSLDSDVILICGFDVCHLCK